MKQVKRFSVPFYFDWTYGVEIKKLREDLDALEKLGVNEIDIQPDENYGGCSVSIEAFTHRLETDEEYNTRISKEKQKEDEIKRKELEQLKKLKAKYKQ